MSEADFDALYRQHLPAVFRYALSCVGRRDIAEDIAAEAFLALYRQFDSIDVEQLPGWLLTVVRRRAIDHWRRMAVEQRGLSAVAHAAPASAAPLVADQTPDQWLIERCASLKPLHRACLLLHVVHGMTRAEIARELGLSENQVKGSLQYALELLRRPQASGEGSR
jgi:RNA polymerase sigma-70 factor (ECF subfamily)